MISSFAPASPSEVQTPALRSLALTCALLAVSHAAPASELPDEATLRSWIEAFKRSPKGPFENIRWFCKDGAVLPPQAYACRAHGGGVQHGALNERAAAMRAGGYVIANVLADLEPDRFVGDDADLDALKQILIERFLIGWDDGWIFRGART